MIERLVDGPLWYQFLLLGALVGRLLLLLLDDVIFARPRRWAQRHTRPGTYGAYLTRCAWCLGFHLAWLVLLAREVWPEATIAASLVSVFSIIGWGVHEVVAPHLHSEVPPPPPPIP